MMWRGGGEEFPNRFHNFSPRANFPHLLDRTEGNNTLSQLRIHSSIYLYGYSDAQKPICCNLDTSYITATQRYRVFRCSSWWFCHGVWAPDQQSKSSVLLYPVLKTKEVTGVPSLNTGGLASTLEQNWEWEKHVFVWQVEWKGAHQLLITFSSPCFGVQIVYNYGHWIHFLDCTTTRSPLPSGYRAKIGWTQSTR